MSEDQKRQLVFKIVILGDNAVGKTSLINQYVQHIFEIDYKPSIGVNIVIKELDLDDLNVKIRLILWDIAGQSKYDLSRNLFFQGSQGAFLVYDMTRPRTFKNIKEKWLNDLQRFAKKDVVFHLIANKNDLTDLKKISTDEGERLAEMLAASYFFETSAKSGENVEEAFEKLVYMMLKERNII
ncbi:MAG: Rab family GTPase [Candidatus Thorarchaeota archaeon]